MRLDKIPDPETFWFEDSKHKKIEHNIWSNTPPFPANWYSMHSKSLQVNYSVYYHDQRESDHFVIRFLNWLLSKMPAKWYRRQAPVKIESSISHSWILIKYLVDNRKFSFYDASVTVSEMCGRCLGMCENELNGKNFVYATNHGCCKYCSVIDPGYLECRRIHSCYRAYFKNNQNIQEVWDRNSYFLGIK
jgi:hypothetical protein